MGWALVTHPQRAKATFGRLLAPMAIEERFLPVAIAQGWTVVIADVDLPADVPVIAQSNPRRTDEEDGA